jgi:hypothetical protein
MSANIYQKSLIRDNSSAVAYEALAFTDGEYVPTNNPVFAGIYVAPGTANGNVNIVGVDDVNRVITLSPGIWPLGGIKILETSTTISTAAVTILF